MESAPDSRRCLLISMPQLQDPNFHQTTTFITEFTKDGAMGLVLNRPLDMMLSQLFEGEVKVESNLPMRVYWGGPVQNQRGFILHEDGEFEADSVEVDKGLYLSGSADILKKLVAKLATPPVPRFRLFLGYAGWGEGQLEQEISQSSWVMTPIDRSFIFDDQPETLWKRSLGAIGVDPASLAAVPQGEAN